MAGAPTRSRRRRDLRRLRERAPGRRLDDGALVRGLHERRDESGAALADRQPLRRLHRSTPTRGCRCRPSPTSTATATTTSRSACPTPTSTVPAAAAPPCSTDKPHGRAHQPRRPLGGRATRTTSTSTIPTLDNQHVGESVASVPDMTGDGWPDIAIGAPQADPGGRTDAGSVWIISGHLPPATGCRRPDGRRDVPVDPPQPADAPRRATASTAPRPATASARRSRASATRTATASPTSRSARRRHRPAGARAPERSSSSPDSTAPRRAISRPRSRCSASTARRPAPGSAPRSRQRATSTATATSTCSPARPGESTFAGAAYLVRGAPGTTTDLAARARQARSPRAPARRPAARSPPGQSLDGSGVDGLIGAPGAGGAFIVSGAGMLNPPVAAAASSRRRRRSSRRRRRSSCRRRRPLVPPAATKPAKLRLCPVKPGEAQDAVPRAPGEGQGQAAGARRPRDCPSGRPSSDQLVATPTRA